MTKMIIFLHTSTVLESSWALLRVLVFVVSHSKTDEVLKSTVLALTFNFSYIFK